MDNPDSGEPSEESTGYNLYENFTELGEALFAIVNNVGCGGVNNTGSDDDRSKDNSNRFLLDQSEQLVEAIELNREEYYDDGEVSSQGIQLVLSSSMESSNGEVTRSVVIGKQTSMKTSADWDGMKDLKISSKEAVWEDKYKQRKSCSNNGNSNGGVCLENRKTYLQSPPELIQQSSEEKYYYAECQQASAIVPSSSSSSLFQEESISSSDDKDTVIEMYCNNKNDCKKETRKTEEDSEETGSAIIMAERDEEETLFQNNVIISKVTIPVSPILNNYNRNVPTPAAVSTYYTSSSDTESILSSSTTTTAKTAEVIYSVNGVTTIQIKPIHHVIDLPAKRAEEIKRNRVQFKKSSRLSQFMSNEFKLDAPIVNAFRVNRLGSAVKRKVGGWVRRIHSEEDSSNAKTSAADMQQQLKAEEKIPGEEEEDEEEVQGQNEFEDLRRLVKQGGDFCKDLATVLQERSELELQYSKGLAKLSSKLLKASKEATGTVAHAWQAVAVQIDTQAELHRLWSVALQEEVARPLKTSTETQSKIRKSVEVLVDKTTRNLAEWRTAEAKSKRQCFSSSKDFEKLQESNPGSEVRSRLLSVPPPDPIKFEAKKRKAEETVRRADIEYYTFCVRSERARLEWESSIRNGSTCLRTLEEEKLTLLKDLAFKYFQAMNDLMPKLNRSTEVLEEPIKSCNVEQDMQSIVLRRHAAAEQLLPDFYAEDTSNLMKKDRRIEALHKCLFLIKQDLDRERKGTIGVENLAKAIADAPKIDNSHHDISDKLYYMKSMLLYLEAARVKLDMALADIEGRPKPVCPVVQYMRHQRDKQGLPQTILKVPSWARDDCLTPSNDSPDWGSDGDRNVEVNHPDHDTDFDEFSSEAGSSDNVYDVHDDDKDVPSIGKCRVVYDYDKNLFDELTIRQGDLINIHDKQEDGWWLGELKGTIGIFPATYVEEIESSE